MEAPDKIYIPTACDELHYHMACPNNEFKESVEYTRTDSFLEKAAKWLSKHATKYYLGAKPMGTDELVEDFKIAMEL